MPSGLSANAIEGEKLAPREQVRAALRCAVEKGTVRRVPYGRGSGFLYKLGTDPSGSPGSPEVRQGFASEGVETLGGGSPPPFSRRRAASLDGEIPFHEFTANGEPPVTADAEPEAVSQSAEAAPDDDAPEPVETPPPRTATATPRLPEDADSWVKRMTRDLPEEDFLWK